VPIVRGHRSSFTHQLTGMAQNNKRFEAMDKRMDAMQIDINLIRHDMQQFFRDLGRHEEAIDNLKSKQ
jgi:hypothetical protein